MNFALPGALCLLACGCGATKVAPPPAPPEFRPPAASSPAAPGASTVAPASGAQDSKPVEAEPRREPPSAKPADAPAAAQEQPPSGAATPPKPAASARPPEGEEKPLGWIAGKPLEAEELLLEWGDLASRELWLVLDKIVAARLGLAEAERLGIRLAPESVEQRYTAEREKLAKKIARGDEPGDVEKFIADELGFDPKRYLERVRRATIRQMLVERAVRAASLADESVALRLIVVVSDESQKAVTEALASGRDFAEVAREHSVDDSKKSGGLVPFVVQDPRSPLSRLAFQTGVGEVAGPMPISDHQFWIKIEEKRAPMTGNWAAIENEIEESLAKNPIGDAEFVHWKITMEGRYPIDFGPLWSLIGAAR